MVIRFGGVHHSLRGHPLAWQRVNSQMNGFQAYDFMNHREQLIDAGSLWPGALLWLPVLPLGSLFVSLV
jgi:hypothetical protein